jgi:hypothetical protein
MLLLLFIGGGGAIKRILRYLNGTMDHGLVPKPTTSLELHAYSDANWAGSINDHRSTSGFYIFFGSRVLRNNQRYLALAQKQNTKVLQSLAPNYYTSNTSLLNFMYHYHILLLFGVIIGATFLAANPMFHARTKYIKIDYHFIRERVISNQLYVRYLCSKD